MILHPSRIRATAPVIGTCGCCDTEAVRLDDRGFCAKPVCREVSADEARALFKPEPWEKEDA